MRLSDSSHRDDAATPLDGILRAGSIRSVLQPIVDLETGALFGFEALARGPEGSPLERPDQLFATARRENRLAELDAACQQAALASAQAHAVRAPLTLFVNAEPDAGGFASLPSTGPGVRGVVELAERTLTSRLAELLPAVQRARTEGWGIALDDVGADTPLAGAHAAAAPRRHQARPAPGPGPHFASMLAAREHTGSNSPEVSSYDFVFTYDRGIIIECAQALMLRIALAEGAKT